MDRRLAGALVFVRLGQRARAGDPRRTAAGAVRRCVAGDVHRHHRRRPGRHRHRRVARRATRRPLRPAAAAPGRPHPRRGAAIAAVPIIRTVGPGADGASPPTIIVPRRHRVLPAGRRCSSAVSPLTVKAAAARRRPHRPGRRSGRGARHRRLAHRCVRHRVHPRRRVPDDAGGDRRSARCSSPAGRRPVVRSLGAAVASRTAIGAGVVVAGPRRR